MRKHLSVFTTAIYLVLTLVLVMPAMAQSDDKVKKGSAPPDAEKSEGKAGKAKKGSAPSAADLTLCVDSGTPDADDPYAAAFTQCTEVDMVAVPKRAECWDDRKHRCKCSEGYFLDRWFSPPRCVEEDVYRTHRAIDASRTRDKEQDARADKVDERMDGMDKADKEFRDAQAALWTGQGERDGKRDRLIGTNVAAISDLYDVTAWLTHEDDLNFWRTEVNGWKIGTLGKVTKTIPRMHLALNIGFLGHARTAVVNEDDDRRFVYRSGFGPYMSLQGELGGTNSFGNGFLVFVGAGGTGGPSLEHTAGLDFSFTMGVAGVFSLVNTLNRSVRLGPMFAMVRDIADIGGEAYLASGTSWVGGLRLDFLESGRPDINLALAGGGGSVKTELGREPSGTFLIRIGFGLSLRSTTPKQCDDPYPEKPAEPGADDKED